MRVFPDYLPLEFGVLLLTLALIAVIAPYAAGHDYGKIKIPEFAPETKKRLKWFGPTALLVALMLHLPVLPKTCTEPTFELVTDRNLCGTTIEEYVATPASAKTCRDQRFGQEGWRYTRETSGSSGWVRGGQSQPDYCNRLLANYLSSRSIGPQHESSVIRSGESARWSGTLGRTREYNYSCTVRVSWEPIYAEQTNGEVCGMNPAVMGRREAVASCKKKTGVRKVQCDA